MAKSPAKTNRKSQSNTPRRAGTRRSLAELNEWLTANHGTLLRKARDNCMDLTGKPTFGGEGAGRGAAKPKKTA